MSITLERDPILQQTSKASRRLSPRLRLQTRARGAVLGGLVLFVLSQLGTALLVEERPELCDPSFEIKYRRFAGLLKQSPQPPAVVVFLGSSMTANAMKADMVDEPLSTALGRPALGFNLGLNGTGPVAHLLYLKRLLRRGLRPDLVVIELSPFFYDHAPSFRPNLLEHGDLDTVERHTKGADLHGAWWRSRLVPLYGHRLEILQQSVSVFAAFDDRVDLLPDVEAHGWRGRPPMPPNEHAEALNIIRGQYKVRLATYKMDDVPLKALRELADVLAAERITAVLVLMPEGPLMRSLYAPGVDAPLMREFDDIGRKYGFPLVNARAWFDEDSFRDSFHMNDQAAVPFTARLLREGIIPALTGR